MGHDHAGIRPVQSITVEVRVDPIHGGSRFGMESNGRGLVEQAFGLNKDANISVVVVPPELVGDMGLNRTYEDRPDITFAITTHGVVYDAAEMAVSLRHAMQARLYCTGYHSYIVTINNDVALELPRNSSRRGIRHDELVAHLARQQPAAQAS